jgi:peptide/nickel transport system permease protein
MMPKGTALLSLVWLALVVGAAIGAPLLTSDDPRQPAGPPLSAPSSRNLLGTDALGRDLWTRMIYGGRVSLSASILAAGITGILGGFFGLIAAVFTGWTERWILWIVNALLAIPGLLLAMLLVAGLGPGLFTVILAVGIAGAPGFARLSRTVFTQIKAQPYVQAAFALGAGKSWVARFHMLPNASSQLLSLITIHVAWAFLGTTTLTFLGLAGDPSIPEWGAMLNVGRLHLVERPHLAVVPGIAISLSILSIHNLGTWLTEISDPKAKR